MKKHNALKIVLIAIATATLLTWILPSGMFQGEFQDLGRIRVGIFDLFSYPTMVLNEVALIPVFILIVGAFYGVLHKTKAYPLLLEKMAAKLKNHSKITLTVISVIVAALAAIVGLEVAILIFFPMIISLVLLMGYDKITAALITVGATMIGMAGSLFANDIQGFLNHILNLEANTLVISRIIILVVGLFILLINVFNRKQVEEVKEEKETKKKTTKKTTKSTAKKDDRVVEIKKPEVKEDVLVWPLVVVLSMTAIIVIMSMISWFGMFEVETFMNASMRVMEFDIREFYIFANIFGQTSFAPFGQWTLVHLSTLLIIMSGLIALVCRLSFNDFIEGFKKGMAKAALPAVITVLIYVVLIIAVFHPFQVTIYNWLVNSLGGAFIPLTSLMAMISSALNIGSGNAYALSIPLLTSNFADPSAQSLYPLIAVIYQSLSSLVMLIAPTSVILMAVLSYLKISYKDWLKSTWKIVLPYLLFLIVLYIILFLRLR